MAEFSGDGFTMTYDGPRRIEVGGAGPVREIVLLGDFEGNLHWAIGTDGVVPFAVATLTNPSRLVVDIQAP